MIYVRNLFKQDLRDGKQVAFPKEVSNVFFEFSYDAPADNPRAITFKYKEQDSNSPFFNYHGIPITTRLYAASSESRIDGELKAFLRDKLNAVIDDIIVIRKLNQSSFEFEFIPKHTISYSGYKNLLRGRNHEVVITSEHKDLPENLFTDLEAFELAPFVQSLNSAGLHIKEQTVYRFVASLLAKRFLILTGLSGSGKTKLAQSFVRWICADKSQYLIVPVAADWTNREPLFGYPNALNPTEYVMPESGVLDLILSAIENENTPYFLILDEMNLSHVERYFADFLSGLESEAEIPLHKCKKAASHSDLSGLPENLEGGENKAIPETVTLPKNLFVIGTVNIDETTYMFSPKVLDRANVIEFRVSEEEIASFLDNPVKPDLDELENAGATMGASFAALAKSKGFTVEEKQVLNEALVTFFGQLKLSGAEFGYRTAHEIHRLAGALYHLWPDYEAWAVIDIAIMQKLLPKVHGSRRKLEPILKEMVRLCVDTDTVNVEDLLGKAYVQPEGDAVYYPMSLEKLHRMYRGAIENGFTSYAEA